MNTDIIVVSEDAALSSYLSKYFQNIYVFQAIEDVDELLDINNSAFVLDIRQKNNSLFSDTMRAIEQRFHLKREQLFVVTNDYFRFDNAYLSKFPFIYDIFQTEKETDIRLIKRLELLLNQNLEAEDSSFSIKRELEYQQIMFQLNEIFMFEENLQLNFFEMDISNVIQLILSKIENSLVVELSLFFEISDDGKELSLSSLSQKDQLEINFTYNFQKDEAFKLFLEKKTAVIDNKLLYFHKLYKKIQTELSLKVKKGTFVPIFKNDKIYGVIVNINKRYDKDFSEIDLTFSQIAANKINQVIEQKRSWYSFANDNNSIVNELVSERDALKEVLNKMEFGIIIYSMQMEIYYSNEMVYSVLGLKHEQSAVTIEDLSGKEISKIIADFSNKAKTEPVSSELVIPIKKGKYKKIGFTISSYFIDEIKDMGFIITFKDITYIENTRENMYRVDKLASLGILASGIAHEIRNPLAGIRTMAETLSEELSNKDQREYTDRIIRQVNRLSTLLKSFFSYAKPSRPEKKAIDLKSIFKEVLPLFSNKIEEKNIKLHEKYEASLEKVPVDPSQIQQVIFNVMLNAIDAMSSGGNLYIETMPATNFSQIINKSQFKFNITDSRYAEITIRDNGSGMDEESLQKVFDPFFTTKAEGTGLGLSIVHQIVNEHGGFIDISSEKGNGTEVRIFLQIE